MLELASTTAVGKTSTWTKASVLSASSAGLTLATAKISSVCGLGLLRLPLRSRRRFWSRLRLALDSKASSGTGTTGVCVKGSTASTALGSRCLLRVSWRRLLRLSSALRSCLRSSLRPSLRESALPSWREALRESVLPSLREALRESVLPSLREALRESVLPSLREVLRASAPPSLRVSLRRLPLRPRRRSSFWLRFGVLRAPLRDSLREEGVLAGAFATTFALGLLLNNPPSTLMIRAPKPGTLVGLAGAILALTGAEGSDCGAGLAGWMLCTAGFSVASGVLASNSLASKWCWAKSIS